MIDILIIILFVTLVLSNLLKAFKWFQEKSNIYGTTKKHQQTELIIEEESSKIDSKNKQKSLIKQTKLTKQTGKTSTRSQPSPFRRVTNDSNDKKQTLPVSPISRKRQQQTAAQLINLQNKLNESLKQNKILESQIKQLNEQKNKISSMTSQSVIHQSIDHRIQQLSQQNNNLTVQLSKFQAQLQNQKLNVENLTQQLFEVKRQSDSLISQMQQKLLKQIQQQKVHIQARNQLQKMIKQCQIKQQQQYKQQIPINNKQIPINNKQIHSHNNDQQKDLFILQLQQKHQQLKSQLQFCQKQIQQYNQNQIKLKQQINKLTEQVQHYKHKSKKQIGISQVVNHPEYLRVKERLMKYQNGNITTSRPKSTIRTEFTPQGERATNTTGSRISERRSLISSKYTSQILGDKGQIKDDDLFAQCNFLNLQNKCFILDEIKKIKKLSIKKTKLIFRLQKLHPTNPHDFIDNIPNIIILIQLTNKKILGAFTQTAFCKDQTQLGITTNNDKSSSAIRSRFGSNKALIIDLTKKIVFPNNTPNDTIIYDQTAIVWGKDELVIKNDQPTLLYSEFGKENAVYWDGKYSLQDFLGSNQGFERINQYQVHRVYIS